MISLRKLWMADEPIDAGAARRVVQLLLQGIALHAVEGDHQDYLTFRQDMQGLLDKVEADLSAASLLVYTGVTLKTLEDYNHRTTRYVRTQGAELQNMIAMLTRTVAELGSGSEQSVGRLHEIAAKLEKTSAIEDVRALKLHMQECLKGIRAESERQKLESARSAAELRQEIQEAQKRIRGAGAAPVADPVTGLPVRAAAVTALGEAALSPEPAYAALFIVQRVALITSRMGYAAGDQVLRLYLEELRQRLPIGDRLFRWSGPAFLALLSRHGKIDRIREQLQLIVPAKLERTIELTNHSALVSISAAWAVFAITLPLGTLTEQLDSFLSSHSATADVSEDIRG